MSEDWGTSKLAKLYGIQKYPVVFVDDVLVVRPEDFGGWGAKEGKYYPWREAANQERFKTDLAQMIDLIRLNRKYELVKNQPTATVRELAALPQLSAQTLDGQAIETARLSGKVTVVEFWATWCGPCRSTLKWLAALKPRYGDNLEVITIALDSKAEEVQKLLQSLNVTIPVVMGKTEVAAPFGTVTSVPTMFVFDRQGKTASVFYGAPKDLHQKASAIIEGLLK